MKTRITYWKIFNDRLKALTDHVDAKHAGGMGAMKAMLILTPLLLIAAFFEYVWISIAGSKPERYK